jgi:PAS domain S-box-containing protein
MTQRTPWRLNHGETIRNRLLPYGVALFSIVVALVLMLVLDPWLEMTKSPFLLFFGAVMLSAWYGGHKPGVFATLLSAFVANYLFMGSRYELALDAINISRMLIFILEGILISSLLGALLKAQKRTQQSLQLLQVSEAKFRRLVDSDIIGVVSCDIYGAITEANNAFLKMVGYTQEDVLAGRVRWDEMTPPDLHHLDVPAYEELITKGKNTPYEKAFIAKDGRRVPIVVGAALIEDESRENVIAFVLDLTRLKQTERALRESEEKYRRIVETANEGIWLNDAQSRTTYVNSRMAQMLGYSVEEMLGRSVFDYVYETDLAEAERSFEQKKQGLTRQYDFRLRCKDGSSIWILSRSSRIFSENGEFLGILSMVTDVTERKRSEQRQLLQYAVSRVLAKAKTLADAMPAIVQSLCESLGWQLGIFWRLEHQSNLLYYTNHWHTPSLDVKEFTEVKQRITFALGEGLPGRIWASGQPAWIVDFIEDENFPRASAAVKVGLHGAFGFPILLEQEILGVIECFSDKVQEPDEDLLEMMASIGSEIGQFIERKRAEEELAKSQQLFLNFMNNVPGTAFIKDEEGRYLFVNPGAEHLANRKQADILGKTDFDILSTEIAQQVRKNDNAVLAAGKPVEILETLPQPDGEQYWMSFKFPIEDVSGKKMLAGMSFDITERKQLENRLQQQAAELTRANSIKDEFLAVLSHELRSPLNPILGWAKLLRTRKLDEATVARALETIERNAQVQIQIIADLLDISRIIRGQLNLNISSVNLVSTVEAAIETVRLAAEAKGIEINLDSRASHPIVLGDSSRLQQVVWNLLSNAVKFTPNRGRVDIRLECVGTNAHITVSDTGKGINPNFLPYVFDYFRQENSATNRQFGGLGLGLAIVRRLVEFHGGSVKADSPGVGQGATFTVTLPLKTAIPQMNREDMQSDDSLNLEGLRVLVVDDDADNLDLITFILEQYGVEVRAVASAKDALSIVIQWQPDLLLSDIGMPEVDGYTLIRQIRALPEEQGGQVRAIALTAYAGEMNQQQALSAGFQEHITKPVDPTELALAITRMCPANRRLVP